MREEIKAEIEDQIPLVLDWINSSAEFVKTQAPDVSNQMLLYHCIIDWLIVLTLLIFLILFWAFPIRWFLEFAKKEENPDEQETVIYVVAWIVTIIIGCILINYGSELIKIHFAPKLFIFEELQKLF